MQPRHPRDSQIAPLLVVIAPLRRLEGIYEVQRQEAKDNPKSKNALISQRDKQSHRVAVGHMEASKIGKRQESEAPRNTENAAIEARRANSGDVRRKSGNAESQILPPPPAGRLERHTRVVLPRRRGLPHDNHK